MMRTFLKVNDRVNDVMTATKGRAIEWQLETLILIPVSNYGYLSKSGDHMTSQALINIQKGHVTPSFHSTDT